MLTRNPASAIERVATETWSECLSYVSLNDHKNMLQTCHFFCDMCRPLVFKHRTMTLSVNPYFSHRDRALAHLDKAAFLAASDVHAPLVRKLTLKYDQRNPQALSQDLKLLYPSFIDYCVDLLPCFPNLRAVYIVSNKNVDRALMSALVLCDLDELGMGPVRFGVHTLSKDVRVRVRRLGIYNNLSDYNPNKSATVLDMFSGERLEDLTIMSRVYAPKIARALALQNNCTLLKSLRVQIFPQDFEALIPFLASCPNLESMEIYFVVSDRKRDRYLSLSLSTPHPQLPRSALPCLKSFCGPDELAMIIVPARPVQNVTTMAGYQSGAIVRRREPGELETLILPRLSQSTGPVMNLVVEQGFFGKDLLDSIVFHTPNLSSLLLNIEDEIGVDGDPFEEEATLNIMRDCQADCNEAPDGDRDAKYLTPLVRHNRYMIIMHWIALRKIHLPVNLEELNLLNRNFSVSWGDTLTLFDRIKTSECAKVDLMNSEERHGRAYTFSMARAIFAEISLLYPSFRLLNLIGATEKVHLYWYKNRSGVWDLCNFNRRSRYS